MISPLTVPDLAELSTIASNIASELTQAQAQQPSSISYLLHPALDYTSSPLPFPQATISIGGSNIVTGLVTSASAPITPIAKSSLPILKDQATLFDLISRHLPPQAKSLALNFAFPMTPITTGKFLDGTLVSGTKEHLLSDLVGRNIAHSLSQFLGIPVATANDVACLSYSTIQDRSTNFISLVVGTGINCSLTISGAVVNTEAANFNQFQNSDVVISLDQTSAKPGKHLFEKEISGAYLPKIFSTLRPDHQPIISTTEQLFTLAQTSQPGSDLAQLVIARSSALTAALITGAFTFLDQPDTEIITEGSLITNPWFQAQVLHYLNLLLPTPLTLVTNHHSSLEGAAQLAFPIKA